MFFPACVRLCPRDLFLSESSWVAAGPPPGTCLLPEKVVVVVVAVCCLSSAFILAYSCMVNTTSLLVAPFVVPTGRLRFPLFPFDNGVFFALLIQILVGRSDDSSSCDSRQLFLLLLF